ncbi:GrpB family protein [Prosthecobacter sp.]|uniref:GrpB family protein n=1 Tax=Prosthecobacter sp. TaxID=1965333 RepID=UPI0037832A2D
MSEVLIGGIEKRQIVIADYDPRWPAQFERQASLISQALGAKALVVEHVGSTSVPGLAAKPIIDIDVLVADSANEASYLEALLTAGYVLRVREPDWHQHRMLRTPQLDVHLHIFSTGCMEFTRHIAFRDWLRTHADDRLLYESTKRRLAAAQWPDMNAYASAKTEVVEAILTRALKNSPVP